MLDAANISFHIDVMRDGTSDQRQVFRWAVPASLVVHSLIAALLIFGLPVSLPEPEKEEAIKVDLVPPPKPPEKAKAEPPPPAQEPKSEEPKKAEAEKPPSTSDDAAQLQPPPAPFLRPVFQFGEKDAGLRESPDGNSAEEGSESPAATHDPDKQDIAEPPAIVTREAMNQAPQPAAPETPASKPADAAKVQKPLKLQKAKKLFSQKITGSQMAITAMAGVPRGARAGTLCSTELDQQLANASPPYFAERVPFDRLEDGTVLEILNTAFSANGQWYNVSYRCEVDEKATKVVSFAFSVGDIVPRSEWKRRGIPSQ
jgi:hypothetical protein